MKNFKEALKPIRCFVFDVDGVLTNNTVLVLQNELHRTMNIRDGFALKEAVDKGYHVVIISGGKSESTRTRFANLGIKDIYLGVPHKTERLDEIKIMYDLKKEEIMYMGDDLPDYHVMQQVGVPTCPNDATHEIRALSMYISPFNGGEGCARDVIEQTLKLHGKWPV